MHAKNHLKESQELMFFFLLRLRRKKIEVEDMFQQCNVERGEMDKRAMLLFIQRLATIWKRRETPTKHTHVKRNGIQTVSTENLSIKLCVY